MRNLKRALSLAVASVMLLGMMVVGTSAASYPDVDSKDNLEAIEVLKAVGVMTGDDKGNFNPDQNVTRNEMAVVMVNLLDLKTEDYKGTAPFTDVPAWAEPYVSACYANKIVSGASATTYNGAASVTAAEAALMLQKALGYFQFQVDFGDDWKVATITNASKIDLFDGVSVAANTALTRNQVAQLALNTLESVVVEGEQAGNTTSITAGDVSIEVTGKTTYTDKKAATKNQSEISYVAEADGKLQLCEDLYGKDLKKGDSRDDFGRPATEWKYKNDSVVVIADDADYTVVLTKENSKYDTAAELAKELKDALDNDDLTEVAGGAKVFINGKDADEIGKDAWNYPAAGVVIELFADSDDVVSDIIAYNYIVVKVDAVDELDEEEDLAEDYGASKVYTLKDFDDNALTYNYVDTLNDEERTDTYKNYQAIGEMKKGDKFVAIVDLDNDEILAIEAIETVEGKKTASGSAYVKVDGTKYTCTAGAAVCGNYDDTWTYYLDPNGVIIAGEEKEAAEADLEYVYVLDAQAKSESEDLFTEGSDKAAVKVMFLDGTKKTISYELKKATKAISGTDIEKDDLYFELNGAKVKFSKTAFESAVDTVDGYWAAYTLNDDDEIVLKSAVKKDVSAVKAITASEDVKTLATNLYATSKTVVTVLDKDGVAKTYTGYANFPKKVNDKAVIDGSALVLFGSSEKYASEVYVYDAEYDVEDTTTIDVAMFVSTGDTVADGTVATFYVDGKKVDYTVAEGDKLIGSAKEGDLFEIELDDDNIATLSKIADKNIVKGTVEVVSDDYVAIKDGKSYDFADSYAVYQVSKDMKSLTKGTLAEDKVVTLILNSEDEVTEIFMWKV